jgi:hypothetical protein
MIFVSTLSSVALIVLLCTCVPGTSPEQPDNCVISRAAKRWLITDWDSASSSPESAQSSRGLRRAAIEVSDDGEET